MVGVNTLIQVGAGGAYGFAIPVNEVRRVAQLLVKEGRVRYPYLGLLLTDVKDLDDAQKTKLGKARRRMARSSQELTPGGPAGKAGMRPGDVITKVNNQKINGAGDVVDYVSGQNIGAKVTLHYRARRQAGPDAGRAGRAARRGSAAGGRGAGAGQGWPRVADADPRRRQLARDWSGAREGAVVTDVVKGSPAESGRTEARRRHGRGRSPAGRFVRRGGFGAARAAEERPPAARSWGLRHPLRNRQVTLTSPASSAGG